jgi:hypothetical protein
MSVSVVEFPFDLYTDAAGKPLDAGFIYVGVANADPVVSPVAVFWDAALTIPAAQPLRTTGGYISRNGAPANFFCASADYSRRICDKKNSQIFYVASKVDVGVTDITLRDGQSLIGEAGSTIDMRDGSTVKIGDNTGVGVEVEFAANARIVGNVVPDTAGSQELGSATRKWFLHSTGVNLDGTIIPPTAGAADVGTDTLPLGDAVSRTARVDDLTAYRTAQPSSVTDYAGLAMLNARTMILACAKQTSTTATAALEPNEAYNVSGITYNAGPLTYTVAFTVPVPENAHIWVQLGWPAGGVWRQRKRRESLVPSVVRLVAVAGRQPKLQRLGATGKRTSAKRSRPRDRHGNR